MTLLQCSYIVLTAVVAALLLLELFRDKNWRTQVAYALVLLPLVLRVLQIK